jgi:tetratricopeptide (TPR) repeat protein
MRKYEKFIIGIFIFTIAVQLTPLPNIKNILFWFSIMLLALSYLFGGYNLFKSGNSNKYVSIIAGFSFFTSLIILPSIIRLEFFSTYKFYPVFNIFFFIALSIYILIKRKSKDKIKDVRSTYIRSAIILIIVSFFCYSPVHFKPYRQIIILLNNGNIPLIGNMEMFNYTNKFDKAIKENDCEQAIYYAEKANQAGKTWLGITQEDIESSENISDFGHISGTYDNLYTAYNCKANAYFDNNAYIKALKYYKSAYNSLYECDYYSSYWQEERAISSNIIGLCYKKLQNYEYADSFFIMAIRNHEIGQNIQNRTLAFFYSNYAESLAEQFQYDYSNSLYNYSNEILLSDLNKTKNDIDLIDNYLCIVKNDIQTDSLNEAVAILEALFKLTAANSKSLATSKLYYGLVLSKRSNYLQANEALNQSLEIFTKILEPTDQNIAENHLAIAQINIALANYDLAKINLATGMEITIKNFGNQSARYANYLKTDAHLDKVIGNYKSSEQKLNQVLTIYNTEYGKRNSHLPEVLAGLADVEIVLAKYNSAKNHSDSSIAIASNHFSFEIPGVTNLINNTAYINYHLGLYRMADSLYRSSIAINNNYKLQSSTQTAIALNGLGLLKTNSKEYTTADSLFTKSIQLHKIIFTENHPLTAIVYLNYSVLKIKENKLQIAKEILNKSLEINKNFFSKEHDVYADIYVSFGDIAKQEKQRNIAKDYYQKALNIYLAKFELNHIKVLLVKDKLKTI